MRRLDVDFKSPRHWPSWARYTILALLLTIAGYQATRVASVLSDTRRLESEAADLRSRIEQVRHDIHAREAAQAEVKPYFRDAQSIARLAEFDYSAPLRAVETVQIQGVRVTAIELSATDGVAKVEIEGPDQAALLRYLEEINQGETTPKWLLQRAQGSTANAAATATIAFTQRAKDD